MRDIIKSKIIKGAFVSLIVMSIVFLALLTVNQYSIFERIAFIASEYFIWIAFIATILLVVLISYGLSEIDFENLVCEQEILINDLGYSDFFYNVKGILLNNGYTYLKQKISTEGQDVYDVLIKKKGYLCNAILFVGEGNISVSAITTLQDSVITSFAEDTSIKQVHCASLIVVDNAKKTVNDYLHYINDLAANQILHSGGFNTLLRNMLVYYSFLLVKQFSFSLGNKKALFYTQKDKLYREFFRLIGIR